MKVQTKHQSPVTTLYLKTMNAVVERKYFLIALLYFILMFSALVLVQLSGKEPTALSAMPQPDRLPVAERTMAGMAVAEGKTNAAIVTLSASPLTSCRIVTFSSSK